MEKTSTNTLSPSFSLAGFIGFLLCDSILNWVLGCKKLYSTSLVELFFGKQKLASFESLKHKPSFNEKVEDGKLSREEVEMVMEKIRIACNHDDDDNKEMVQDRLGSNELSVLFDDQEPSLEEVKETFDVFDENKDGFVDATELQRVLCSFRFLEGLKLEDCEKMIRVFDVNRDGRIDFSEFVKLMENSFS